MVPSFNATFPPMIEPIVRAVADQDSFAFIATAQVEWQPGVHGPREILEEFSRCGDPAHTRLHLDHIPTVDETTGQPNDYYGIIKDAMDLGYSSVMIDGSHEGLLDRNIAATRRIVDLAAPRGVFVEAEVGCMYGYDSDASPSYDEVFGKRLGFTTESEVSRMVAESGCDWISVAAGNVHGALIGKAKGEDKPRSRLDLDLVERLSAAANAPLVIHGGSGIEIDNLLAAFKLGVAKINVAKTLRLCYTRALARSEAVSAAQKALYEQTRRLIDDYHIAGSAGIVTRDPPRNP
jgi:fructose/tagatose bisphosphate aldolase